jgi:hypothetical protein
MNVIRAIALSFAMIPFPQPRAAIQSNIAVLDALPTASAPANRIDLDKVKAEQGYPPEGLTDCQQMEWFRVNVGLPVRFWALGNRESGKGVCDNNAISKTYCCVGWWQLHKIIFTDHRMIGRLEACGATWLNVRGDSLEAKKRQACATKALFDVAGYSPWNL